MRDLLHPIYKFAGHCLCRIIILFCVLRDKLHPPKEDTLLVVTHPDDDTLFFHTKINEYKPYVALMVTGWSLKRLFDFIRVMNYYGVKFRPYDTVEDMPYTEERILKQVKAVYAAGDFKRCLTHNSSGEYGHRNHALVHKCVINNVDCEVFVPVSKERIKMFPLDEETVTEKTMIFNEFYKTETFVIEQYNEWLVNEQLERFIPDEKD